MRVLTWLVGLPVGLFLAFMLFGAAIKATETPAERAASDKAAREKCVRAITSSLGTSTRNYRDKQAYETHVHENCEGFKLSK